MAQEICAKDTFMSSLCLYIEKLQRDVQNLSFNFSYLLLSLSLLLWHRLKLIRIRQKEKFSGRSFQTTRGRLQWTSIGRLNGRPRDVSNQASNEYSNRTFRNVKIKHPSDVRIGRNANEHTSPDVPYVRRRKLLPTYRGCSFLVCDLKPSRGRIMYVINILTPAGMFL